MDENKRPDEGLIARLAACDMTLSEYESLTDEEFTDIEHKALRENKVPKPPKISDSRWKQPLELTPRHKMVIHLAAMGKNHATISAETGMSQGRVGTFLAAKDIKALVAKKQNNIFENDAKDYMKVLMNKAYAVFEEILDPYSDAKPSVRLEAAKYVTDHVIGKSAQIVEHRSSVLSEFLQRLDSEKEAKAITMARITNMPDEPEYVDNVVDAEIIADEVATAKKILETNKDAMDTLVDSLIGDGLVVGKRDKDETKS